jgi:molybdenum cofactor biosynthesis enzyme MoaA
VANIKDSVRELNTDDMKKVIFLVKNELDCNMIALMGGEPLLRKDLPDLVQHMSDLSIYSYLTTNGTLLNDKMIYKLCENELDFLEISLDGIKPNQFSKKNRRSAKFLLLIK